MNVLKFLKQKICGRMNINKILKGNTSKKVLERCMGRNDERLCPNCNKPILHNRASSFCNSQCEKQYANKRILDDQEKYFNKMVRDSNKK